MSDLYDLEVGDRVQIFDRYSKSSGPHGRDGVVIKKGRVLITVCPVGIPRSDVYRMDTGRINDDYGHSYIKTPEQAVRDAYERDVRDKLYSLGVRFDYGVNPSISKLEAIIKVMEEE